MGNNQSQQVKTQTVVVQAVNKQGQTKTIPVTVVTSSTVPPVQAEKQYSFKSFVQCATDSLLGVGPWIHKQKAELADNQVVKTWRQTRASFNTEVQAPLCNLYNAIPEKLTQAKFELISPYTYNQRFTTLNVLCALTAIATITSTKGNPVGRILRSTRNAGFMYLIGGLLIAPQIYNPFIRS